VYFDPPYDDTFNGYTTEGTFDQSALAETARELAARGCHVIVSNADTPRVREFYRGFDIEVVRSPRSVNSDAAGRGDVDELIITNKPQRKIMATQTEIPGTEDKTRVPAVEEAIGLWLDAKVQQRRASDESKNKHATMIALFAEHKLDSHMYTDPKSGKQRRLWLAAEKKAKSSAVAAPRVSGRRGRRGGPRRDVDAEIAGEDKAPKEDTTVEMRRVPRKSVEKEIDGFGSVRERMEAKQADAARQTEKAKRGKGKKAK
jgi:hypothetical protein